MIIKSKGLQVRLRGRELLNDRYCLIKTKKKASMLGEFKNNFLIVSHSRERVFLFVKKRKVILAQRIILLPAVSKNHGSSVI